MPQFLSGAVGGEGRVAIGNAGPFIDIFWTVTVPGPASYLSVMPPKKLLHLGWVGVGWDAPGSGTETVNWFKFVDFEREVIAFLANQVQGDYLCWHFEGAAVVAIGVDW